jgi:hypothetical protein
MVKALFLISKGCQGMWLDAVSHTVENRGTEDLTAVLVELKK